MPSANVIAQGMFCGAKYAYTFLPIISIRVVTLVAISFLLSTANEWGKTLSNCEEVWWMKKTLSNQTMRKCDEWKKLSNQTMRKCNEWRKNTPSNQTMRKCGEWKKNPKTVKWNYEEVWWMEKTVKSNCEEVWWRGRMEERMEGLTPLNAGYY